MNLAFADSSPATLDTCASAAPCGSRGCERPATLRRTTVRFLALAIATLFAAACGGGGGGGKRRDTYAAATSAQEACCENLAGEPRDTCLREIVRVSDEAVARSDANQATYACVQEHFACDAATGRATQESAQAQLDCIQDLQ